METASRDRIWVHGVLDTRVCPPVCFCVTVLQQQHWYHLVPLLGMGTSMMLGGCGYLTMPCFMVMEAVKQFDICISQVQESCFPCILSTCMQYIFVSGFDLIFTMSMWNYMRKMAINAVDMHISTLCFFQKYNIPLSFLFLLLCMCLWTPVPCLPGNSVTHPSDFLFSIIELQPQEYLSLPGSNFVWAIK